MDIDVLNEPFVFFFTLKHLTNGSFRNIFEMVSTCRYVLSLGFLILKNVFFSIVNMMQTHIHKAQNALSVYPIDTQLKVTDFNCIVVLFS